MFLSAARCRPAVVRRHPNGHDAAGAHVVRCCHLVDVGGDPGRARLALPASRHLQKEAARQIRLGVVGGCGAPRAMVRFESITPTVSRRSEKWFTAILIDNIIMHIYIYVFTFIHMHNTTIRCPIYVIV